MIIFQTKQYRQQISVAIVFQTKMSFALNFPLLIALFSTGRWLRVVSCHAGHAPTPNHWWNSGESRLQQNICQRLWSNQRQTHRRSLERFQRVTMYFQMTHANSRSSTPRVHVIQTICFSGMKSPWGAAVCSAQPGHLPGENQTLENGDEQDTDAWTHTDVNTQTYMIHMEPCLPCDRLRGPISLQPEIARTSIFHES
jgi:hypothetical protein